MNGGRIINNNASSPPPVTNIISRGGGIFLTYGGTFIMNGGEISGNTAYDYGGGVYVGGGIFNKTGGTILGYQDGNNNSNVVKNAAGLVQQQRGHAVHVHHTNSFYIMGKDSTSGPSDNLSIDATVDPPTWSGLWDY